ncbi:KxYKxGKxW signal peptide domain-containing protein [Lactobacillus sp. LC28-10]|uniref:KxYKxGKxW signal peptide domain-containing protein n=1 Tax=Secundilactobacillus angelensis TaxID=2722706 RepID=A0ABX1L0U3_9LACO|nr:KxYKxGKxW signal peptide domain-containing protein [Secundilactobacillus angelensis]MCH5462771.1 KxYKxGKxW signal peptide domain-containing protein [Secundilactobacillus angelensis]NLR19075.1 KxYKxGKxW signal peptide domain-containing protein [Secundilactobacillus angelensis]
MNQKLTRMASTPHYKSYKDGKHWVTACLTSVALLGAMAIAPKASAATTEASSTDDTTPVSDESANATTTKQVTLTSPTTDTQSDSATADAATPAAKPDATESDITAGAETSDTVSDATAAKAASTAIDAQQSDKTATKQDTTTTNSQNTTANTATTEKKATTGFTARVGETSNVTMTYVDNKTNQVITSGTQPAPVGTSTTIPVISGGELNGQPTILKLVSYSLDGGQSISNFDPTTGPTVTIPDEANTSLQLNVEVNPVVKTTINYQQKGTNTTTVYTAANEVVAGLTPAKVNAPSGYDTSGDVTVTVTPSDFGASQNLKPMTFEINNATQTVIDSTKDPDGNIATYEQAFNYLAQFGIKLDGTVAIPNYAIAAAVKSVTFTVPIIDKGIVSVRYTHEDQTPLDPSVTNVTVSTDGTGKTEIQANDPENAGKDQTANLKEIILKTAATSTTPAREFIYAFDGYDQASNTFNKAFATMKTFNEDTNSYENTPDESTGNSWYDQMAQKFGVGVPYINDATNKAADKLVQSLSDKGIGTDGSVNATSPDFVSNLTGVQFVYANNQQNPDQIGTFTFEMKTTDGQVLLSTTKPNYDKADGQPVAGAYMSVYYPDGNAGQTYYLPLNYKETLTDQNGQSITLNIPLGFQVVNYTTDNLEKPESNINGSGSAETTNEFGDLNISQQLYKITDPSRDSNFTLIVKLVPAQQTVDYIDDTGAKLTPTKTLNGAYDPATKQANYDKVQGSDVKLANHGALKQIILESSPAGTVLSQSPQGEALGLVPTKYIRYTFNSTDPKGDVVIDAYDVTPDGQHTATVPYDQAVAILKANGIDVDGTDAAPNYFTFETTQNVKFVYAKAAATTPTGPDTTTPTGPDTTTPTGPDTTTPTNPSTPTDNNAGGATTPETNQGTAPAGNGSTAPADNNETTPEQTAGSNGTATNTAPTSTTGNTNASGVVTPTASKGTQSATTNTNKLPQTDEHANSSLALLGLSLMGLVGLGAFVSRKRRD